MSPVEQTTERIAALFERIAAVIEGYAEHRRKITEAMGGDHERR